MWVIIGEEKFISERLGVPDSSSLSPWTIASAETSLPPASIYLDLSGCFAKHRPHNTPSDAWWIVHAPAYTLSELPGHTIRLNAWPGFATGTDWEMAWNGDEAAAIATTVCHSLKKNPISAPDQIGLIGARILIAIINEALLLNHEGAADEIDIDVAMRLGTNYPRGPFQWAAEIGWNEVHFLRKRLEVLDHTSH